jgi:hypothetical protein
MTARPQPKVYISEASLHILQLILRYTKDCKNNKHTHKKNQT